jgi:hypothetical protein
MNDALLLQLLETLVVEVRAGKHTCVKLGIEDDATLRVSFELAAGSGPARQACSSCGSLTLRDAGGGDVVCMECNNNQRAASPRRTEP